MNLKKRICSAVLLIGIVAAVAGAGFFGLPIKEREKNQPSVPENQKETIYFWYTDEALTDYLNSAAVAYGESHNARVIPVLTSGLEYLEGINKASLQSEAYPDLYVISNDSLEKAYLSGLAAKVEESVWDDIKEEYPDAARLAATYKGDIIAYPWYFETSALLYNRTYLEEFAARQIKAEAVETTAEEELETGMDEGMPDLENIGEESNEPAVDEEKLREKVKELLPNTIQDILSFANEYDAPEQVEAIFKWDVTDIFYNYFFAGNYLNVGGEAGDSTANMDIYNKDAIRCLQVYQDLNQFFSIDTKEISYEDVLNDFIQGKIVYTVATTDAVAKLEEAKAAGEFQYEYSIAVVPDIDEVLQTRSLSVTNCIVINGYTNHRKLAEDFARFLTSEYVSTLYARSGKVAARYGVDYGNMNLQEFVNEYDVSIPVPKMVETSNFWMELEVVFSQIWNGADVNERLRLLSEKMMTQVQGQPYIEPVLKLEENETEETGEIEYLDEEELRREAMDSE
ncbi:MAG: extracellular solute-binding protein [Lachnospiraceae bacterium]|nr:extracellular solute-binding protein [Lachnospiraceae bacterium]